MPDRKELFLLVIDGPRISADSPGEASQLLAEIRQNICQHISREKSIDAVLLLGDITASSLDRDFMLAKEVVDGILDECLNSVGLQDFPPVLAVPGPNDQTRVTTKSASSAALTRWWRETNRALWTGGYVDVVQAVRQNFELFCEWTEKCWTHSPTAGHQGLLAGDGSLELLLKGTNVGFITINSVFRMHIEEPNEGLVTIEPDQVAQAVGEDLGDWMNRQDLVVLLAGRHADIQMQTTTPLLMISGIDQGEGTAPASPWLDLTSFQARYSILRVAISEAEGSEVEILDGKSHGLHPNTQVVPQGAIPTLRSNEPSDTSAKDSASDSVSRYRDLDLLDSIISTGRIILVVTSGIESDSANSRGGLLVNSDELASRIMMKLIARAQAGQLPLQDVLAQARARKLPLSKIIEDSLVAVGDRVSHLATTILRGPWARIYDFTGTSILSHAIEKNTHLHSTVIMVDATKKQPTPGVDKLEIVAMNGIPGHPASESDLDFSAANPTSDSPRDLWWGQFDTDLLLHPVVYLSHDAASNSLWFCLHSFTSSIGSDSTDGLNEPEQPRFVVAPETDSTTQFRMSSFLIRHISSSPERFIQERLGSNRECIAEGQRKRARVHARLSHGTGLQMVGALLDDAAPGSSNFLKGHEPTWGDIKDNIAVRLSRVSDLSRAGKSLNERLPVIILSGRAGSGKSATLMRYAMELHRQGQAVAWVNRDATHRSTEIRDRAASLELDAVFIDDVEIFGTNSYPILRELNRNGKTLVVASIRTTRIDVVEPATGATRLSQDDPLKKADFHKLVKVLERNRMLGALKKIQPMAARAEHFGSISDRNLLAGMVQVVSGERLEDKIRREYSELDRNEAAAYAVVCLLISVAYEARAIPVSDLLQILSARRSRRDINSDIRRLVRARLLIRFDESRVTSPHRVIADKIVENLKKNPEQLGRYLADLLWYYASRASEIRDTIHPYRRPMIRLLSHSVMATLQLPPEIVRGIYASVHDLLKDDFHYWLQCGRYEIERGDLDDASRYLEAARGCEGGSADYRVITAAGSIALRRSIKSPSDKALLEVSRQSFSELIGVVRIQGKQSPHTFVVLLRDGYDWLTCAHSLPAQERLTYAQELRKVAELGMLLLADNPEVFFVAKKYTPLLSRLADPSQGIPL